MKAKVFERVELIFEEKVISAFLTSEHGEKNELYAFVYEPIKLQYDIEGIETAVNDGEPYYMIRFTPKSEGEYLFEATLENGENVKQNITVKGFANNGFIKVSDKDKRYFSYSNGERYFPVGVNICFPRRLPVTDNSEFGRKDEVCYMGLKPYERWFKRFAENGVNLVRLWLGHEYFSPDTLNVEEFDLAQFSKIDMILALAKKYGMKLKITFEQFRYFDYNIENPDNFARHFNKNLYLEGERCESIEEWTTSEKWKNAWLLKVREFAKRYAGETEIFAVELWNEMNCVPNTDAWNREMLPKVKEMFPDNMVINSLGSLDCEWALDCYNSFPWELSSFKQLHCYHDQGAKFEKVRINPIEALNYDIGLIKSENQPLIVAETGGVNNCHCAETKYYSSDDRGMFLVDCVYTPVFLGCAGCGNIWHWDERYIESKNLYKFFKPLAELVKNIDFTEQNFKSFDLSDQDVYLFILKGKDISLGFIRNKSDCWQNVLRDMNEPETVKKKRIRFDCKEISQVKIWQDDTTEIKIKDGKIVFDNLLYGTTFIIK